MLAVLENDCQLAVGFAVLRAATISVNSYLTKSVLQHYKCLVDWLEGRAVERLPLSQETTNQNTQQLAQVCFFSASFCIKITFDQMHSILYFRFNSNHHYFGPKSRSFGQNQTKTGAKTKPLKCKPKLTPYEVALLVDSITAI